LGVFVGGQLKDVILAGDVSTALIEQSGDPLFSYTNSTGGNENLGIYVDNGQFNTGTGDTEDITASVRYTK